MNKLIVAFQGEPGAYSAQAVRQHFGDDTEMLPCHSFSAIFEAVSSGKATYGMLPIENTLGGTVAGAYEELLETDLRIRGEEIAKVDHCFLAPKGAKLDDIQQAISHPQALAQCRKTLERMGIKEVVHFDTAGAAKDLAENPDRYPNTIAIASELAGNMYGLDFLGRGMGDEPNNFTRMFVIGKESAPRQDPCKTSIIFTTTHTPGALHKAMGELVNRNLNMTKVESRPRRNRPWMYYFFIDFEGHADDPIVQEALVAILKQSSFLKVLGSFTAAKQPQVQ